MSFPTTPFEDSGGTAWTSYPEGEAFLSAVASGSALARLVKIGSSYNGLPITAVVVGGPEAPRWSEVEDCCFIVASLHGNEETPREAAYRFVRDLAFSPGPDLARLQETPLVVIPTANPDGTTANTRGNGEGVDLNRDHLALSQPETRAIARSILSTSPVFVLDGHEGSDALFQVNGAYFAKGAARAIKELAPSLVAVLEAEFLDYSYGDYPFTDHEGTLQSAATLRGIPYLLLETLSSQGDLQQADQHYRSMLSMYRFVCDNKAAVMSVRSEAMSSYLIEGLAAYAPHYGYESGAIPARRGYRVHRGADLQTLRLLGAAIVDGPEGGTGAYISMAQPAAGLLPLVLDPLAPRQVIAAVPVDDGVGEVQGLRDGFYPPAAVAHLGGELHDAIRLVSHVEGDRQVVWSV